ncbi:MAG: UvrD-helicase domain-containing protein [Thermoguttaceae bacterium]|nr:UvrD-helicase domain-containing protein [Thermoguttaceae bacterium]
MSLNEAQRAAVETLTGPLLVLAGAGTGKTRVVTYRIARLIRSGVEPDRILAVTFTNKAAREMLERVSALLPQRADKKKPEISTFHSLCVRILRRNIHRLGYPNQFSIYDRGDQESVARQVLQAIKLASGTLRPGDLISKMSDWKSSGMRPVQALNSARDSKEYLFATAYSRYQARLRDLGAVDFDDILLLTEDLFEQFPEVLAEESGRFDRILVDEYQDTNMSQYRIISGLAAPHRNLCVVGDDDQAIYGWRGAEVRHILNFKRDWPDAQTIRLEENYRSTSQILAWANRLIDFNTYRHAKKLRSVVQGDQPRILQCKTGELEAKTVIASIKQRLAQTKRRPRDFAILFRTNEQPRAFEMELREAKIPYTIVGGQSFFDRKEIKDVISYLKILVRPSDDVALLRVINTPPRGIGSTTLAKVREFAISQKTSVWKAIQPGSEVFGKLDARTQEAANEFHNLMRAQAQRMRASFSRENVDAFLNAVKYYDEIAKTYPDETERKARLESVGEVLDAVDAYLKDHPGATLLNFLDDASLGGPDFSSQQDKRSKLDAVLLSTYHAAKGLEFKEVYMVGMEEGILPHHRSLEDVSEDGVEEERRLCYVGVTRAQFRLTLSLAVGRVKRGKLKPTIPSRFLYEMTGQADNPRYLSIKAGKASNSGKK